MTIGGGYKLDIWVLKEALDYERVQDSLDEVASLAAEVLLRLDEVEAVEIDVKGDPEHVDQFKKVDGNFYKLSYFSGIELTTKEGTDEQWADTLCNLGAALVSLGLTSTAEDWEYFHKTTIETSD